MKRWFKSESTHPIWIPAFWPDHDSMLEKTGIQIRRIDSDLNCLFNFVEADFTARNSGVRSLFCCAPYFRLNDVSRTDPACSQSSLLKAPLDIKQAITDERYRGLKKPVRREGGWYMIECRGYLTIKKRRRLGILFFKFLSFWYFFTNIRIIKIYLTNKVLEQRQCRKKKSHLTFNCTFTQKWKFN